MYGHFGSNHSEKSLPKLKNFLIDIKLPNVNLRNRESFAISPFRTRLQPAAGSGIYQL